MFYLRPTPLNLSSGGIRLPALQEEANCGFRLGRGGGEAEGREDNAENERNRKKERG